MEQDADPVDETAANQRLIVVIIAFLSLACVLVVLQPGYDPHMPSAPESASRAAPSWVTSP